MVMRRSKILTSGLRPSLSLQFAGAGALDPRITFTRASIGTFVGSNGLIQTASSGQPRFGYDPASLAPLGYLSEEQRTNLAPHSGDMADATWVATGNGTAKTSTNNLAPDGTNTAALITANGASSPHALQGPSASYVNGTQYAVSIFAKAGTSSLIQLITGSISGTAATVYANFSLSGAGSVTASGAGVSSPTITAYQNGWYRLAFVFTAGATIVDWGTSPIFINSGTDGRFPTITNSGTLQVWGGQIEATSANYPGPTSYIPTAGSTVTRAADVASMTGTNFSSWYNQSAGSFVDQVTVPTLNQIGVVSCADSTVALNRFQITKINATNNGAGMRWNGILNNASPVLVSTTNVAINTCKVAFAATANDAALYSDGNQLATQGPTFAMPTPTILDIGHNTGTNQLNGFIASIKYYPRRLTNAQLQVLTA